MYILECMKKLYGIILGIIGIFSTQQIISQTLAEKLGYKATDKLLIVTAENAGLCNSVNDAIIQILQKGVVTSTSVMAPCPWSCEIVDFAHRNPSYSYGLELTLTADYKTL